MGAASLCYSPWRSLQTLLSSINTTHAEIIRLVELVCASRVLPDSAAKPEARILAYLAREWSQDAVAQGSESRLTVGNVAHYALDREGDVPGQAIVRTNIKRLRNHLASFFNDTSEGRSCSHRLVIDSEHGLYILRLAQKVQSPLEAFWRRHLEGVDNVITWAEPLVFFDKTTRRYIRFLDINSDSLDPRVIDAVVPKDHEARGMIPCFHYQSSGDILAVHLLQSWFAQHDHEITAEVTRDTTESKVFNYNSLIVGNMRMNKYVARLQEDLDFTVAGSSVTIRRPDLDRKEREEYSDYEPFADPKKGDRPYAYAVLTRRPNVNQLMTTTMIAANHGRAIQKVAQYITSEKHVAQLYRQWIERDHGEWPAWLQVLFQVEIRNRDMVFQDATPIAVRAYPEGIDTN